MVSIHAPARGATLTKEINKLEKMFQSTHPHGVRHMCWSQSRLLICFNPRTRTGCDHSRGVSLRMRYGFQSTHPHGVRHVLQLRKAQALQFQSTHPHGVRLYFCFPICSWTCFNPRTRTGCDSGGIHIPRRLTVSIHAPARGATLLWQPLARCSTCFNPRTRTGCDPSVIFLASI